MITQIVVRAMEKLKAVKVKVVALIIIIHIKSHLLVILTILPSVVREDLCLPMIFVGRGMTDAFHA